MHTRSTVAGFALALLLTTSCSKDKDAKPEPATASASSTPAATSAPAAVSAQPGPSATAVANVATGDAGKAAVETPASADPEKHDADLKTVQEVADQVCACTTAECAQTATERLSDFKGIKDADEAAAKPLLLKIAQCAAKAAGAAAPSGDGKAVLKEFSDLVDGICACKDMECIAKASPKLSELGKKLSLAISNVENAEALQKHAERLSKCMTSVAAPAAPTAAPAGTGAAVVATGGPATAPLSYRTYTNNAYSYLVDVASIFTSNTPFMGEAGREWKWGNKALMNVAAIPAKDMSLKDWYDAAKKEPGVMGSNLAANWFMKTGKKGGKIFWQKSLMDSGRPFLFTLRLEYDEELKAFFDPIVSRASRTFKMIMP